MNRFVPVDNHEFTGGCLFVFMAIEAEETKSHDVTNSPQEAPVSPQATGVLSYVAEFLKIFIVAAAIILSYGANPIKPLDPSATNNSTISLPAKSYFKRFSFAN